MKKIVGSSCIAALAGAVALSVGQVGASAAAAPPPQGETAPVCPPGYVPASPEECPPPGYAAPRSAAAPRRHNRIFSPYNTSVTAGAGVGDYAGGGLNGASEAGPAWDARVTVGTRSILALEAAYMGSFNAVEGSVGHIASNGVDGDLRVQLPYRVQPYIFGGVGYNNMALSSAGRDDPTMNTRFRSSDNQLTVPAGGGVAGYLGQHATLDARFTYHAIFDNDFNLQSTERMHQWSVLGRVGYAF